MQTLGIIGGSGLYDLPGLAHVRRSRVQTPFGAPSEAYTQGELDGVRLVFLPRHGQGHRWLPTEINSRANIWGFRKLGVRRVVSFSAVGSLRERIAPGDLVVVDQFIDRTRARPASFFGEGLVAHVSLADPFCPELATAVLAAVRAVGARVHRRGTYLCIEGPQFSTRAESRLYRGFGADVIGMTNLPEARLAREASLCFSTVALATDYDCWRRPDEHVTADAVVAMVQRNVATARRVIAELVGRLPAERGCGCPRALEGSIMTAPGAIPAATRRRLAPLLEGVLAGRPGPKKGARRSRRSRD